MDVLEDDSLESIMARLNAVAPRGLEVLGGKVMPDKVKKMMAICNYAIYEVKGPVTEQNVDWDSLLKPFNEATEISYEKVTPKKTRIIDVKEFVKEPIVASVPQGTIKPSEVWNLGKDQYNWPITSGYEIHRKAIMVENEEGRFTPLEINY